MRTLQRKALEMTFQYNRNCAREKLKRQRSAKLKFHIDTSGYTQEEVARMVGVTRVTLNKKIHNMESLTLKEVNSFIKVLKLGLIDSVDLFL